MTDQELDQLAEKIAGGMVGNIEFNDKNRDKVDEEAFQRSRQYRSRIGAETEPPSVKPSPFRGR